jgi:chromosome segregation ATPase
VLGILALVAASDATLAQVERSGGGVNAQLVQQYQQAVTDRDQLQADNDKIKQELDGTKRQLEAVKQQLTAFKSTTNTAATQLAAAQAADRSTRQSLEQSRSAMQDLIAHYRQIVTTLSGVETDRSRLQQQLAQSKAAFDQCAVANYELYQADNEVLDRYAHQGVFSYATRAEPFTRLERTRIDNLVLQYRERAEELRVQRTPAAPTSPAPGTRPAPAPKTTN